MPNYCLFASLEMERSKRELEKQVRNILLWRIRMTCAFIVAKNCYLGISTKVKNWFKNVDMCRKMLCHWNARDKYWLGRQSSNPEKSEFWDLNNTWTLPALCPQWRLPISSDQLINSPHGMEVKMWNFQTALKSLNTVLESLMHLL